MKRQLSNLSSLLQRFKVVIPLIQRDYAHGRNNRQAESIRKELIKSFLDTLASDEILHLDFIYGRIEDNIETTLVPFDGQQRLTTLYLFHRYIYEIENVFDENKRRVWRNFLYETRQSARDFCEALCEHNIISVSSCTKEIIDIEDQSWFSVDWRDDPTVKGMIRVLYEIDKMVRHDKRVLDYTKLDDITFALANMGDMRMSDMDYISMNSKGRPLSAWENFKAKLIEKHKNFLPVQESKLDNEWANFFFSLESDETKNRYDERMMRMIHLHLYSLEMISKCEGTGKLSDSLTIPEIDAQGHIPFTPFSAYDAILCTNENPLSPVFNFWDALTDNRQQIVNSILPSWGESDRDVFLGYSERRITLPELLIFFACLKFYGILGANTSIQILKAWLRVVWNIVENSSIDNGNISNHLVFINALANETLNFDSSQEVSNYNFWKNLSNVHVDDYSTAKEQLNHEIAKANYLKVKPDALDSIVSAESDPWCKGKIEMLLLSSDSSSTLPDFIHLDNNLEKLQKLRRDLEENRSDILYRIFCTICNEHGHISWDITFPLKDTADWKIQINKKCWKPILQRYFKGAPLDSMLESAIIDNNNSSLKMSIRAFLITYKFILSKYARFWLCQGEYRIATKPSCKYQNCYFMDSYAELEQLLFNSISLGWGDRGSFEVSSMFDGNYTIKRKAPTGNSEPIDVSLDCLLNYRGCADTLATVLDMAFKSPH